MRLFIFLLIATSEVRAEVANIAVASNFSHILRLIADDFMSKTGHQLLISSASSGKLYTQIHSALFDIFLAADKIRPDRLTFRKVTLPGNYKELMRLAIANPKTAPYGAAAQQTLERLQLWGSVKKNGNG